MNLNALSNRRSFTRLVAGAGGAALALALAGCGAAASGTGSGSTAASSGPAQTINLVATEFSYQPQQIKVTGPGDVKVVLENRGVVEHDFVITGAQGSLKVQPKQTGSAVFKIPKAGAYQFSCSVEGHKEAGMFGTLTVS